MQTSYVSLPSLNTRIRRIRYVEAVMQIVGGSTGIKRERLEKELIDRSVTEELFQVLKLSKEPSSGHFFESLSLNYEIAYERLFKRKSNPAERIASTYVTMAVAMGLVIEQDGIVSSSQSSLPLRFILEMENLSDEQKKCIKHYYFASLLIATDRDVICPLLKTIVDQSDGVTISEIESNWTRWITDWVDCLINIITQEQAGNPAQLFKFNMLATQRWKKPERYAEHLALIRYHWLIDLKIISGDPQNNPSRFYLDNNSSVSQEIKKFFKTELKQIISGDVENIFFLISKGYSEKPIEDAVVFFETNIKKFLAYAKIRGISNIRLTFIDFIWCSLRALNKSLPLDFGDIRNEVDLSLKTSGIMVLKAPTRDQSYLPTR
jgi:hypothetical protein